MSRGLAFKLLCSTNKNKTRKSRDKKFINASLKSYNNASFAFALIQDKTELNL